MRILTEEDCFQQLDREAWNVKEAVFISHGYWPGDAKELANLINQNSEAMDLLCRLSEAVMVGSLAAKKISLPQSSLSDAETYYLFQPFHFIKWLVSRPAIKVSTMFLKAIEKIYQSYLDGLGPSGLLKKNNRPLEEQEDKHNIRLIFRTLLQQYGDGVPRHFIIGKAAKVDAAATTFSAKALDRWLKEEEEKLGIKRKVGRPKGA